LTQDTLKIREYQRMSVLRVDTKPIRSFMDLKPGDCIVGFSKRVLFALKKSINEKLDQNYVKRPPEFRYSKDASKVHKKKMNRKFEEWLEKNPIDNK